MSWIPPGFVVWLLLVLIASAVFFALLPQRPRPYASVLALTAAGWVLGQIWLTVGWAAWRIGQADVFPAFLFALLLQAAAPYLPRHLNLPRFGGPARGN